MPVPAAALKILQVAGAIHTTYVLAKAAIDAIATSPEKDHVDPHGNQTARGKVWRPWASVGLLDLRWSVQAQVVPEAPRGQFLTEFAVVLHREEALGVGAKLPVTVELVPSWYSADAAGFVTLPAGTFDVELPIGSHVAKGFLTMDGSQAFFGDGPQKFSLHAKILTPDSFVKWTARPVPPDGPMFRKEQDTEDGLAIDFDYLHMPWE